MIRAIVVMVCIFCLCSPASIAQVFAATKKIELLDTLAFYKDSDLDGVIDLRDLCTGTPLNQDIDYKGCPIIHLKQFFVHFDIQFETAKHELKPEFHSRLKDLAQFLYNSPETLILIEGHTDNVGEDDFNIPLSERRAQSIANAFISTFNIPSDQIRSIGHGEHLPITSNLTEAGQKENRRVSGEIIKRIPWPESMRLKNIENEKGQVIIPFSFTQDLSTYQQDTLKVTLKKETQDIIDQVITILGAHPEAFLLIEGHTDNTGEPDFNNRVSKQRAQAVADAIYEKYFILRKKLKAIGHGQSMPAYSNKTDLGRQKNRRVEISLATRYQAEKKVTLPKWSIWNAGEELPYQEISDQKEPEAQNRASQSPAFWDIMR
ncbi:OmpA family protein [Marinomonas sp.]|nr:OmpA family protein [Marinomonas sp.]MDB4837879.1 OmpA family protein [Marinomonas sp.]